MTSDGAKAALALEPHPVSVFYAGLMKEMAALGLHVKIRHKPNEVADAIPFEEDDTHRSYDREYVNRYWRVLLQSQRVFTAFRARFIGKCSPVHLFWGAPDLAVTRFSGRTAPSHPGGVPNTPDAVVRDAYSHEVSSCGFWAGGGPVPYPAYYSYAYPEPQGFEDVRVKPAEAYYSQDLREFILPYDAVRLSPSPTNTLLDFAQTTYEAAADLGQWDRRGLERALPVDT